jgi:hypothetical protein
MIIKSRIRWKRHVCEEIRNAYNSLTGKPEWKIPFGRSRRRKDNIKMDLGVKCGSRVQTRFMWLKTFTSDRLL